MDNVYISIIGDVVRSKSISQEDRKNFQKSLKEDLERFNTKYQKQIVAKLIVTLGDEFQGLFSDPLVAFEIIAYLQVKYPYQFRYGVGIGKLYTELNEISLGMDGPVFWNARKSLDAIKRDRKESTNIKISGLKNEVLETMINNSLIFVQHLIANWNENQKAVLREILALYGLNNQFKQKEIANQFNYDPSKISRVLKSTQFYAYVDYITSLAKLIMAEVKDYD